MERFLGKIGEPLFFLVMAGAMVPIFLFETEVNEPFKLAFTYLSLPILIVSFALSKLLLPVWHDKVGPLKANGFTLLVALLLILFSGCYVIAANALVGKQTPIKLEGKITNKTETKGSRRGGGFQLTIHDFKSINEITVVTTEKEYNNTNIGDSYSKNWVVGSLGLIYKRK